MHKEGEEKKQWLNAKSEQRQGEVRLGGWGHPHSGSIMGVGCHISNAVAFAVQWIIMALLLLTFMCFELRQIRRRHAHKMKKESSKKNAPPSLGESSLAKDLCDFSRVSVETICKQFLAALSKWTKHRSFTSSTSLIWFNPPAPLECFVLNWISVLFSCHWFLQIFCGSLCCFALSRWGEKEGERGRTFGSLAPRGYLSQWQIKHSRN